MSDPFRHIIAYGGPQTPQQRQPAAGIPKNLFDKDTAIKTPSILFKSSDSADFFPISIEINDDKGRTLVIDKKSEKEFYTLKIKTEDGTKEIQLKITDAVKIDVLDLIEKLNLKERVKEYDDDVLIKAFNKLFEEIKKLPPVSYGKRFQA